MTKVRRFDVFFCNTCKREGKVTLNGIFTTNSIKDKRKAFKSSCGCSSGFRYDDISASLALTSEANRRGYKFLGFVDNKFKTLITTKIILNCDEHGEWSSCTAANFMKNRSCPKCADNSRAKSKVKTDKLERLTSLAEERGFTILSEITHKSLNKDRIDVRCHNCDYIFDLTICNFLRGRGCPCCAGKNQKLLYLNVIRDEFGENTDYMKIGITNNLHNRLESQNSRNAYKMFHMHTWQFTDPKSCRDCEKYIKQMIIRGSRPIDKLRFKDGYSEVLHISHYMDVMDIVYDFGGKEIMNCKLVNAIEEMFKDNIIK